MGRDVSSGTVSDEEAVDVAEENLDVEVATGGGASQGNVGVGRGAVSEYKAGGSSDGAEDAPNPRNGATCAHSFAIVLGPPESDGKELGDVGVNLGAETVVERDVTSPNVVGELRRPELTAAHGKSESDDASVAVRAPTVACESEYGGLKKIEGDERGTLRCVEELTGPQEELNRRGGVKGVGTVRSAM